LLIAAAAPAVASAAMDIQLAFPSLPFFDTPTGIVDPLDGTNRLFVLEKGGTVRVFHNDVTVSTSTLFLDLSDSTSTDLECGLLGMAFHPDYAHNGYFYVTYISKAKPGLTWVLARYHVSADPNVADPNSEERLIEIPQGNNIHKGGQIVFGPDGYMYVSVGDDGDTSQPQLLDSLKGKILRIDVDHPSGGLNYGIPDGNPYKINAQDYRREIWAFGFRNPWRFNFAPDGRLWEGDVGLNTWEEVNIVEREGNYGWPLMEGTQCDYPSPCDTTGLNLKLPLYEYVHESEYGEAIIGGYVYEGTQMPELRGRYIYADTQNNHVWALYWNGINEATSTLVFDYPTNIFFHITSIGQDSNHELFFVSYYGGIFQLTGTPSAVGRESPKVPDVLLSAQPNPFVRETRIRFVSSGPARVDIYDVSGRLAQRLDSPSHGEREITWDGRNLAGNASPSGVYFVRLVQDGRTLGTRRIVLLK
jgi:glucose/arabinose dehydrogenase